MAESTEETKKQSNAIVETKGSDAHRQKGKLRLKQPTVYLMMCFQTQFNAPKFLLVPD
jgi:hypothetical protein